MQLNNTIHNLFKNDILKIKDLNKIPKFNNFSIEDFVNYLSNDTIDNSIIKVIQQNIINYASSIVLDLNNENLDNQYILKHIQNIDYVLSYSSYMYYSGNEIIENKLFDGENGQQTLINSYLNGHPSPEKNFFNFYINFVNKYNPDILQNENVETYSNIEQRMSEVIFNPTSSLELTNISNKTKEKELPLIVKKWIEEKGFSLSYFKKIFNEFQEKQKVIGEEGSTIIKSTNMQEIEDSINKFIPAYYGPKLDGASGYIHYVNENGLFNFKGFYGRGGKSSLTNITYKAPMIKSIKKTFNYDNHNIEELEIRGEIIIKKIGTTSNTLNVINSELKTYGINTEYTNLRNAAAGMIKNEDIPPQILEKYLDFIPFHTYEIKQEEDKKNAHKVDNDIAIQSYKKNNMEIIPNIRIEDTEKAMALYNLMDCISNDLEHEHLKPILGNDIYNSLLSYPYECDGVILTSTSTTGKVNKNNELEGVVALKFSPPTEKTIIKNIKIDMNKSNISFVVEIEPTYIGGVTVENVSGAVKETKDINTFIQTYRTGQEIEIARSGGVIPNLLTPIDNETNSIYDLIFNKLKDISKYMKKLKLIDTHELEDFLDILENTFNSNYNSTSKTHWMKIKIGCIQNNLINTKKEPIKKSIIDTMVYLIKETITTKDKDKQNKIKDFLNELKNNIKIEEFYSKKEVLEIISSCPSCNEPLITSDTGKQLSCINDSCNSRRVSKLTTYLLGLQSKGNKTNIDDKKMQAILTFMKKKIYKKGETQTSITDYLKLYEIMNNPTIKEEILKYSEETKDEDNALAFKEKRTDKFIQDIKNTIGVSESVFLGSLNIEGFAKSNAKKLLSKKSLEELLNFDYSNEINKNQLKIDISNINEFGEKTASLIINFIEKNQSDLLKLYHIVEPKIEEKPKTIEVSRELQMTGTGSFSWDFFKTIDPNGVSITKEIPYKEISLSKGGKEEIKQVLKNEQLVVDFQGEKIKLIGGGNPSGKTNIVISDTIKEATSKAKNLKSKIILSDTKSENEIKDFINLVKNDFINQEGEKVCIITTSQFFLDIFKCNFQEQTIENNNYL